MAGVEQGDLTAVADYYMDIFAVDEMSNETQIRKEDDRYVSIPDSMKEAAHINEGHRRKAMEEQEEGESTYECIAEDELHSKREAPQQEKVSKREESANTDTGGDLPTPDAYREHIQDAQTTFFSISKVLKCACMIAASIVAVCIPVTSVLIVWSSDHVTNLTTVTMTTNKTLFKEEVEYLAVNITTPQNQKSLTNQPRIPMPDKQINSKPFKVYSTAKRVNQTPVTNLRTFPGTKYRELKISVTDKMLYKKPVTDNILPTTSQKMTNSTKVDVKESFFKIPSGKKTVNDLPTIDFDIYFTKRFDRINLPVSIPEAQHISFIRSHIWVIVEKLGAIFVYTTNLQFYTRIDIKKPYDAIEVTDRKIIVSTYYVIYWIYGFNKHYHQVLIEKYSVSALALYQDQFFTYEPKQHTIRQYQYQKGNKINNMWKKLIEFQTKFHRPEFSGKYQNSKATIVIKKNKTDLLHFYVSSNEKSWTEEYIYDLFINGTLKTHGPADMSRSEMKMYRRKAEAHEYPEPLICGIDKKSNLLLASTSKNITWVSIYNPHTGNYTKVSKLGGFRMKDVIIKGRSLWLVYEMRGAGYNLVKYKVTDLKIH